MSRAHAVQFGEWGQQGSYYVEFLLRAPLMPIEMDVVAQASSVVLNLIHRYAISGDVVFIRRLKGTQHVVLHLAVGSRSCAVKMILTCDHFLPDAVLTIDDAQSGEVPATNHRLLVVIFFMNGGIFSKQLLLMLMIRSFVSFVALDLKTGKFNTTTPEKTIPVFTIVVVVGAKTIDVVEYKLLVAGDNSFVIGVLADLQKLFKGMNVLSLMLRKVFRRSLSAEHYVSFYKGEIAEMVLKFGSEDSAQTKTLPVLGNKRTG